MATRYIDRTNNTGTLTGTWTSTGTAVAGTGGDAVNELNVGDYVWLNVSDLTAYRVTNITDANTFTIDQDPSVNDYEGAFSAATLLFSTVSINDGTTIAKAYPSYEACKLLETQVAGDVWYYRGGQTEYFHDGSVALIETSGTGPTVITKFICDVDGSIFSDSSPGRTILSYERRRTTAWSTGADYWELRGFKFQSHSNGDSRHTMCHFYTCIGGLMVDCFWSTDGGWSGDSAMFEFDQGDSSRIEFRDCNFETDGATFMSVGNNARGHYTRIYCVRCSFYKNSGTGGTAFATSGGTPGVDLIDCNFGYDEDGVEGTLSNGLSNVSGVSYLSNPKFNCTEDINVDTSTYRSIVYIEDYDQVHEDNRAYFANGFMQRETTTVRSGGGDESIKMTPNSNCDSLMPLLGGWWAYGLPVVNDTTSTTVDIYINSFTYSVLPTADELYVEFSYYDNASIATRTIIKSTDTISSNGTWTKFTSGSFTPSKAGLVFCRVFLKLYEASSGIYIDPVPVITT